MVTLLLLCRAQRKIDIKGGKINVGSSPFVKAKYTSRLFCSHHRALLSIAIKAPRSRLESVNIQIRHTHSSLLIHAGQEPRQNQLQPNYTCTRFTGFYPHCVYVCVFILYLVSVYLGHLRVQKLLALNVLLPSFVFQYEFYSTYTASLCYPFQCYT